MSTAMESAFANATKRGPAKSSDKPAPAPRLGSEEIRARRMSRLMGKADATLVISDDDVTLFVEISEELRAKERELEPLRKKNSTIPVEEINRTTAVIEAAARDCREDLASLSANFPGIVVKAAQREELRSSARNSIRAIRQLDPANIDEHAVRDFLANAVQSGAIKEDGSSYVASVEDPVLQELEDRVNDFLKAMKVAREEEQRERVANVQDYLLGDRQVSG